MKHVARLHELKGGSFEAAFSALIADVTALEQCVKQEMVRLVAQLDNDINIVGSPPTRENEHLLKMHGVERGGTTKTGWQSESSENVDFSATGGSGTSSQATYCSAKRAFSSATRTSPLGASSLQLPAPLLHNRLNAIDCWDDSEEASTTLVSTGTVDSSKQRQVFGRGRAPMGDSDPLGMCTEDDVEAKPNALELGQVDLSVSVVPRSLDRGQPSNNSLGTCLSSDSDIVASSPAAVKLLESRCGGPPSPNAQRRGVSFHEEADRSVAADSNSMRDGVHTESGGHTNSLKPSESLKPHVRAGRRLNAQNVTAAASDFVVKSFQVHPQWGHEDWMRAVPLTQIKEGAHKNQKLDARFELEMDRLTSQTCPTEARCPCMSRFMLSPMVASSVAVDLTFVLLILYDFITVPLMLLEPPDTALTLGMNWVSRFVWTLSIPRSFFTGYMRIDGIIEMRPSVVAKQYMSSWLMFDLVVVAAAWVEALVQTRNLGSLRVLKTARAVRILRVIRIVKVIKTPPLLTKVFNDIYSEKVILYLSIMLNTLWFLGVIHYIACIWYGLGANYDPGYGIESWVKTRSLKDASFVKKYTISLHWAICQFIGSMDVLAVTTVERAYAILVLIFSFMFSASFISKITAAMTRLQILTGNMGVQFASLRKFLNSHSISPDLSMRVIACADYIVEEKQRNRSISDIELLSMVSEPLRAEIHYEVYCPELTVHPFFRRYHDINPVALQRLCHSAVEVMSLSFGDVLFCEGEEPTRPSMLFCSMGTLLYMKRDSEEVAVISEGMSFCEQVLWSNWVHMGTVRAAKNCNLMGLDADTFRRITAEYRKEAYAAMYASEFVARMNQALVNLEEVDDVKCGLNVHELVAKIFPRTAFTIKPTRAKNYIGQRRRAKTEESWFYNGNVARPSSHSNATNVSQMTGLDHEPSSPGTSSKAQFWSMTPWRPVNVKHTSNSYAMGQASRSYAIGTTPSETENDQSVVG